jgi:hypothetical protein
MTISRVYAVPTDLPRARLYLDDVAEIVRILDEALTDPNRSHDLQLKRELTVDETKLTDDVNDLPKIAKSTRDFIIKASRGYQFTARLRIGQFRPSLTTYGLNYPEQLAVFHRVEEIFSARRLFWQNLSQGFIDATWSSLWSLALFVICPMVFVGLVARLLEKVLSLSFRWAVGIPTVLIAVALIVVMASYFRSSTVIFSNFSEQAAARRGSTVKFLVETAKMIVVFLLGLLSYYLAHRFWPHG